MQQPTELGKWRGPVRPRTNGSLLRQFTQVSPSSEAVSYNSPKKAGTGLSVAPRFKRKSAIVLHLPFKDRREAGQFLAAQLAKLNFSLNKNTVMLGLARGGVPVAAEVAATLHLLLDVIVVRKLGAPNHKEFAIGAVAGGRIQVLNHNLIAELGIPTSEFEATAAKEMDLAIWREHFYRSERTAMKLHNWTVILIDDGLATGSSMLAAVHYLNSFRPKKVIAAAPVGTAEACARLKEHADACVCLAIPQDFQAVSQFYRNFNQVSDDEVRQILEQNYRCVGPPVTTRRTSLN